MEKFFCESTLSASAQMSDFLERLKIGVVNIDNSIPPDSSGVITRKLQKKYVSDSFDTLGLELSEDAEILSVAKNSPAAVAQIPPYFMIYEVNDTYVGNRSAFKDVANGALNLVIKLQSVAGMTELISKILQDEDHQMDGPSNQSLKLGELLETTPRFNFLSHEHPLFLRYKERLSKERLAISLIRQRTKEAEDEQMRVVRERIEKAALEVQTASEAAAKPPATSPPPIEKTPEPAPNGAEPFFEVFDSDNIFSVDANVDAVKKPATPPSEPLEKVSNTELLALVVGSPLEAVSGSSALSISKPPPVDDNNDDGEVHFAILPSEEYSLLNGEKVIMSLIKRRGPLPAPPPGLPPITISTSSRADTAAAHRSEEMPRSPPKTDAASAKKTSPSRSVERHDQHDNSHSDKHRSKRYRRERTPERKRSKSRYY